MRENNLGGALRDLAERNEGEKAIQYLEQSVEAFGNALQVRTREHLPQGWAMTKNNLGGALSDLAERSEGEKAAQYFGQAVEAYSNALLVKTEAADPVQWTRTMSNLAHAYELKGDRTNALETYRQLLRHYPDDQNWKQKMAEIEKNL